MYISYKDRIENLEKENVELKETNAHTLSQLNLDNGELIIENERLKKENVELKKRNGELAGQKASLERWLGEAKAIIKNVTYGEGWNYSLDWKVKAEQFLKEE